MNALFGAGLAAVLALVAADATAADKTWHAETFTTSPAGIHVTHYWSKGADRMRAETVAAGHRLITIVNGDRYYSVDATQGRAISIERGPHARETGKGRGRLIGLEGFIIQKRGGEKVKSEKLAGQMCDVYVHTDGDGKQQVWVQQDARKDLLPMRTEIYSRRAAATIRTDYVQWAEGLELPDRLFEPDPRFPITSYGYQEYVDKFTGSERPPVPVLHPNLLHGEKD